MSSASSLIAISLYVNSVPLILTVREPYKFKECLDLVELCFTQLIAHRKT